MADPVTAGIGLLGIGLSAAGGIVGAQGAAYTGQAQKAQADYQAAIAGMNAKLAEADARYAEEAGVSEQVVAGLRGREAVGAIKAGFGAGNIDPTKGSARNVITSQEVVNQFNQEMILANAAKRAYGFRVQAAGDTAQGRLYTLAGQTAETAAGYGVTSSLLGAAGSVSSKYLQAKQSGLFSGAKQTGLFGGLFDQSTTTT
jgi:hypothetical protein